ncbi:hypothetical protein BDV27DRAFT_172036 [Aspergillus caelatus]|uniref:Fe2OG dioxygenase domain-containing protein n=1 Tax=Aspergillus caelatus TaxID=61420 RepID=A0A5N7AJJ3_9EURO|nr:uncharacterized protein BDV27DRAFT_172036 [Aspergillus caelatus]KAE8369843.1 hypothetical protein BDV27DRAFT_172036 [Aspergillus caelatus]
MPSAVAVAPTATTPVPKKHVVVGPTNKKYTPATKKLPESLVLLARNVEKQEFDPARHLNIIPPKKILRMADIGLEGVGISDTAVSEPFSLWTEDAVKQMRAEIFSEAMLENCQVSSSFASNMVRGYNAKLAPFIHKAYHSPELLEAVSAIAGIDLVPVFDYEVGHCNISFNEKKPTKAELEKMGENGDSEAFSWHRDSFPFVCVTMLSDCRDMVGGETVIRTGDGRTMKTRGPTMGRYIEHMALKSFGGGERISIITPFRPKSPFARDDTVLTTVRGISRQDPLYHDYAEYRMRNLKARVDRQLELIQKGRSQGGRFDVEGARAWLSEQQEYIESMLTEMFDYEN